MRQEINYLVLQGGGIRCAWQAGFIAAFERTIPLRPRAISAVSASSAVACALVCRRLEFAVDCFKAAIASKTKNTLVARMLKGQRIFPHADIYRNTVLRIFDQVAMESLFAGPDIRILVTRMSAKLPKYPGMLAGLSLCGLQGFGAGRCYRRMEAQFGFRKEFVPVKRCATPADLADLVLASSCTPPFTPFYSLHGRPVLDGGLTESVPLGGLPDKQGLILALLTAKLPKTDRVRGILYAEPSEEIRVGGWTYDTEKIDYLYALGQKDGRSFLNGLWNNV
jgi:predicted patatin/cPLA2 family phospholipase